ncbi:superoxide dismutase [Caproicibacter fermentans]|uniref:Superoxide dismutase n=1 Tax=Caproicibacter fermentans TaxID=2576756 RepID=A0A7G8TDH8_9FIRM|nr:superoxide dismutase [Caproicibacter fermentans]QNK41669.1 superoxide dismutase [Caproicibacter fermentans]
MNSHYPFELPPLPYSYNALEPYLDPETLKFHHDKHFKAYVDNLNQALEKLPAYQNWTLERLIRENYRLPFQVQTAVWNNAGGVYNHNLYFNLMEHPGNQEPEGKLHSAILSAFGSMDKFYQKLKTCAQSQFGSGYGWLVADCRGRLKVLNTLNQDTPLPRGFCPVLLVDVWEHAYYLQYQNRRGEYLDAFMRLINWAAAEENYLGCFARPMQRPGRK